MAKILTLLEDERLSPTIEDDMHILKYPIIRPLRRLETIYTCLAAGTETTVPPTHIFED